MATINSATSPCRKDTSGGKGNKGMYIERDPRICAAGVISNQPKANVAECLEHYLLQEHIDALKHDAVVPSPAVPEPPPLRHPPRLDMRFAHRCDVANVVNPLPKNKFQTLRNEFLETTYKSSWKNILGRGPDSTPMLPEGFDTYGTTMGKKTPYHGRLYDIVMPKEPFPDNTPHSKKAGVQTDRKFCRPAFNPDLIYGHRTGVDFRGRSAKCCLSDDKVKLGLANMQIITLSEADKQNLTKPVVGKVHAPNDNIESVPKGFAFGLLKKPDYVADCLTTCELNPGSRFFKFCLARLNTLRRCMSKKFPTTFFATFYLELKHFDKDKTGWIPKEVVYQQCALRYIRFDPAFLEPLFTVWNIFDGKNIEYKTFVFLLNYRESSPDLPKIEDVDPEKCLYFSTTYREMIKPRPPDKSKMAGVPSGRYFDMDYPVTPLYGCKADRSCLGMESDMKCCMNPSVYTLANVSHRDLYAVRQPEVVKRVFEAAGERFDGDKFEQAWKEAQKHHSKGSVCVETFKRALNELNNVNQPAT